MTDRKPLLCLDFDGVIHSYSSGWQGATNIPDPPVPGAIEFILKALKHFRVAVYSTRSNADGGRYAMRKYLRRHWLAAGHAGEMEEQIEWPTSKPPAFLTIDDRALTFSGDWPNPVDLLSFKPWTNIGRDNMFAWMSNIRSLDGSPGQPVEFGAVERKPFAWAREPDPVRLATEPMHIRYKRQAERPEGDGWFPLYRDPE